MQKLLSAIYRVGQRFGSAHVIDVLRGISSEKVLQWGHDRLSTFGIGATRSEAEWRSILRQAIAAQYVFVDYEAFNALKLTEWARPVLKGEKTVLLRPYVKPDRRHKTKSAERHSRPVLPLREQKLFERLKWWRMEVARQQNLPAYVILQDSALREIAIAKPETADELLQISGIGSKRLSMWGEDILRLVGEFIFSSV